MADLAKSAVVVDSVWSEGGVNGRRYVSKRVHATLAAMGTAANKLPAAAFGMTKIHGCSSLVKADNSVVLPATPSVDGSQILVGGGAANVLADYTGVFYFTVRGFPL